MKSNLGLLGAFVFAFGGAILFEGLYQLSYVINHNSISDIGPPSIGPDIIGFWGFLFVGLGLWLIVQSGKPEKPEIERQKEKEAMYYKSR